MNIQEELVRLNSSEAFRIACLFLAQNSVPLDPHEQLSFPTQTDAFKFIAQKFGKKYNAVKFTRDMFDQLTDSDRRGWQRALRPAEQKIWDAYGSLSRNELFEFVSEILKSNWQVDQDSQLPDLSEIISDCKYRLSLIPTSSIKVSDGLLSRICLAFKKIGGFRSVEMVGGHTFCIITQENYYFTVSIQELARCWAVIPYVEPIQRYEAIVDLMPGALDFRNRTGDAASSVFGKIPSTEWRNSSDPKKRIEQSKVEQIDRFLDSQFSNDKTSFDRFKKFLENPSWSGISKKLNRNDWIQAGIVSVGEWLNEAAGKRGELVIALSELQSFDDELSKIVEESTKAVDYNPAAITEYIKGAENVIYYGAPGTGKSYKIDDETDVDNNFTVRTVFHPDTQNSDFVGALKPAKLDDKVTYEYSPGPFSLALSMAYNNPNQKVALIIEELNRAPAAAVFGELFLLLDRNDDGSGRYDVNFSSPEFERWFFKETGFTGKKFRLPSNLWIYATMNSADQGVYPLDAAFRRRWRQEYLPIIYKAAPAGNINVTGVKETISVPWSELLKNLNDELSQVFKVGEDRLLGHYFLTKSDLSGTGAMPQKVLLYLFDDVLRHANGRERLFDESIKTVGDLITKSEQGQRIFSETFLKRLLGKDSEAEV